VNGIKLRNCIALPLLFAFLAAIFGCERNYVPPPPRAPGVPLEAIWSGGSGGGVWIVAKKIADSQDRYACRIFFDSTGDLWADGDYVLRRVDWDSSRRQAIYSRAPNVPEKLELQGFDGELIFLRDSLVLAPVTLRYRINEAHPTPRTRIE
jgi:hypothetical protein